MITLTIDLGNGRSVSVSVPQDFTVTEAKEIGKRALSFASGLGFRR